MKGSGQRRGLPRDPDHEAPRVRSERWCSPHASGRRRRKSRRHFLREHVVLIAILECRVRGRAAVGLAFSRRKERLSIRYKLVAFAVATICSKAAH